MCFESGKQSMPIVAAMLNSSLTQPTGKVFYFLSTSEACKRIYYKNHDLFKMRKYTR